MLKCGDAGFSKRVQHPMAITLATNGGRILLPYTKGVADGVSVKRGNAR